jgi:hypothetical protein
VKFSAPADQYDVKFGNLDDVCPWTKWEDPRFLKLVEAAMVSGVALTREQVLAALPDAGFEGVVE